MSELRDAIESLVGRYKPQDQGLEPIMSRKRERGSRLRVGPRTAIAFSAVLFLSLTTFGAGYAVGNTNRQSKVKVIQSSQRRVSAAVSQACPVVRGAVTVLDLPQGAPGTIVTVSGPIYYLAENGSFFAPQVDDYQVWWNLNESDYGTVTPDAVAIAQGQKPQGHDSGALMVGDDAPNGTCSFTAKFQVPQVPPGTYPVTIVNAGSDGTTSYGSFTFQVV